MEIENRLCRHHFFLTTMKLIINADDCGRTRAVDLAIGEYADKGLISSTTVMANMDDFDGALSLHKAYGTRIGFGLHINLTEGSPLTQSQVLLDEGFYSETEGKILFTGTSNAYCKLSREGRKAVYKEMEAQLSRLLDNGIVPDHVDSHQHVHFSRNIFPLFLKFGREHDIKRMRRSDNTQPFYSLPNEIFKHIWRPVSFLLNPGCKTTDFFCSVSRFVQMYNNGEVNQHKSYELMCHPGHELAEYKHDSDLLSQEPMRTIIKNVGITGLGNF